MHCALGRLHCALRRLHSVLGRLHSGLGRLHSALGRLHSALGCTGNFAFHDGCSHSSSSRGNEHVTPTSPTPRHAMPQHATPYRRPTPPRLAPSRRQRLRSRLHRWAVGRSTRLQTNGCAGRRDVPERVSDSTTTAPRAAAEQSRWVAHSILVCSSRMGAVWACPAKGTEVRAPFAPPARDQSHSSDCWQADACPWACIAVARGVDVAYGPHDCYGCRLAGKDAPCPVHRAQV